MSVEFYRGSPGKFDSRTLSRKTLSRWTGRTRARGRAHPFHARMVVLPVLLVVLPVLLVVLPYTYTYTYIIYIYNIIYIYIYIYICARARQAADLARPLVGGWCRAVTGIGGEAGDGSGAIYNICIYIYIYIYIEREREIMHILIYIYGTSKYIYYYTNTILC